MTAVLKAPIRQLLQLQWKPYSAASRLSYILWTHLISATCLIKAALNNRRQILLLQHTIFHQYYSLSVHFYPISFVKILFNIFHVPISSPVR